MKTKFTILVLLAVFGLSSLLQAQSKKQQILTLNNKVDSLNTVISNKKQEFDKAILEKSDTIIARDKKISELTSESEELNKTILEKSDTITVRDKKISELTLENEALKKTVLILKDSIDAENQTIKELSSMNSEVVSITSLQLIYYDEQYPKSEEVDNPTDGGEININGCMEYNLKKLIVKGNSGEKVSFVIKDNKGDILFQRNDININESTIFNSEGANKFDNYPETKIYIMHNEKVLYHFTVTNSGCF